MVTLAIIDIVLILTLFFCFIVGFIYGLIHIIGTIVGGILGIWAGSVYAGPLSSALAARFSWAGGAVAEWIIFFVIVGIVMKLGVLLFKGLEWLFGILTIIPFLRTFDRLLGGVLLLGIGALGLGLLIHALEQFSFRGFDLGSYLAPSKAAPFLTGIGEYLEPIVPAIINTVRSYI